MEFKDLYIGQLIILYNNSSESYFGIVQEIFDKDVDIYWIQYEKVFKNTIKLIKDCEDYKSIDFDKDIKELLD